MIKDTVNLLFAEQLENWELAKKNYKALDLVKIKTLDVDGCRYKVQFNPARIVSSSAKVDDDSIRKRNCFLCSANRPAEQKGVPFGERYTILVNPFPVFPRHLTIVDITHTPQRIDESRFADMLDLAKELDDYAVFYNGPKCGASAPDHFHFQAGNKGFLPIENEKKTRYDIRIEAENKEEMLHQFGQIYDSLPTSPDDPEPMMNIITWFENNLWTTRLFPRKKHRPCRYFAEGDDNMMISPASIDMGGVFVMPLEKDFEKITDNDIADILNEVAFVQSAFELRIEN